MGERVFRSAGVIRADALAILERRAADPALSGRPLVVVQHHPPFVRKTSALHWVDGLIGAANLMVLLEKFQHLFVFHGHLHAVVNRVLGCGVARVLGATAVVDDGDTPHVRVFDVRGGRLEAVGLPSSEKSTPLVVRSPVPALALASALPTPPLH